MIRTDNYIVKPLAGITLLITLCLLFYGCKEKYLPEIKEGNLSYLVVEGLINTGADSTVFELSRTFKLNNKTIEAPEKGAIVQVESEAGTIYVLPALVKAGRYGRPSLGLDPTQKYRLRIRTTDKRECLSDFVESRTSPAIDEIKYDFKNDYLNIYANTHDATGKSRYYRYSYIETMEYTSALPSYLKVENKKVVDRIFPDDNIWRCWRGFSSHNVILGSTTNLAQDELADQYITSVQAGSLKIRLAYSILVKQYVLTKDGFDFYESLKKNTESVGSIFDAQPSQLFGNIRSTTNPSETVIGFISAGTVTEKRVTLNVTDMPIEWFAPRYVDPACADSVVRMSEASIVTQHPLFIPLQLVMGGYEASRSKYCVDCRVQGGSSIKPSYWP